MSVWDFVIRRRPADLDPAAPVNSYRDWPTIRKVSYSALGGAIAGTIGGAIGCSHFDVPALVPGDTYFSVFRKTSAIIGRCAIVSGVAVGSAQLVQDVVDHQVGRRSFLGALSAGSTTGFLLFALCTVSLCFPRHQREEEAV